MTHQTSEPRFVFGGISLPFSSKPSIYVAQTGPRFSLQSHGEKADGDEERGEADAEPPQRRRRRTGPRGASFQSQGTRFLLLYGWMSDFHCFGWLIYSSDVFLFQKQLEDYLNNLLKMPMYRNYHATVRITGV